MGGTARTRVAREERGDPWLGGPEALGVGHVGKACVQGPAPDVTSPPPPPLCPEQLYVATVLQEPEMNLTPASSPARHTYGTMNRQLEEGEEESGVRGFARELDSAKFQEGLELEGQSQYH